MLSADVVGGCCRRMLSAVLSLDIVDGCVIDGCVLSDGFVVETMCTSSLRLVGCCWLLSSLSVDVVVVGCCRWVLSVCWLSFVIRDCVIVFIA